MAKDEDLENRIHKYHKLLEEGHINADEFQKLVAKEEEKIEAKKPKIRHKFRNFLIAALIFGTGLLIYKAFQPKFSKDAEIELRQTIAEEIDRHGSGYFLMPKGVKGIDIDGKKYTIDFHDDKATVIEVGKEFIMPMSVEKEGRTYWYDIRIKDDEFVYMKRKIFVIGGGCQGPKNLQEKTRYSRNQSRQPQPVECKEKKTHTRAMRLVEAIEELKEKGNSFYSYNDPKIKEIHAADFSVTKEHQLLRNYEYWVFDDFNSDGKQDFAFSSKLDNKVLTAISTKDGFKTQLFNYAPFQLETGLRPTNSEKSLWKVPWVPQEPENKASCKYLFCALGKLEGDIYNNSASYYWFYFDPKSDQILCWRTYKPLTQLKK